MNEKKKKRNKWISFIAFIMFWSLLISGGVFGSKMYIEHLKQQIVTDLSNQMKDQLSNVQTDVEGQINDMESNILIDIESLQEQINSFNELLNFTKDSTNDQTDNSNQLYSQLLQLGDRLNELQQELDLIK
ncbi:hypothetical protein [Chengkuizengella sediminis]|uniref:hypothetical protein n=1 Tax=Chengkuizengella sediminis TaxID=1885917 RepID=UPI001389E65F|nr:hypothetical protein [Chengkuizengella sediminis]NDI35857.1 hypothetical protein [Chengkuizengella sediminis]